MGNELAVRTEDKPAVATNQPTTDERRHAELVKQLEAAFESNPKRAKELATILAAEFPTRYTGAWLLEIVKRIDDAAKIRGLIKTLKAQFVAQPAAAKATATTLATEYPDLFSKAWLAEITRKIDRAQQQKRIADEIRSCLATAQSTWDRRPETAKSALRRAMQLAPRDAKLRQWATRFIAQVDDFQDNQIMANFDRPSPAKEAAERFHRRNPRRFTAANLADFKQRVDAYQDRMWANRVGEDEVRAWLGANAFEYVEEAPAEVKQELMILLGRMKRDQLLAPGGGGVRSKAQLANPTSEVQRMDVLDRSDDVSTTFQFSTAEQLVPKTLERQARQLDTEATKVRDDKVPIQTNPNPLLTEQPSAITTITNQALDSRADDLQRSAVAYRDLATRLRTGQTTIAAEREKMELDRQALNWEAIRLRDAIPGMQGNPQEARVAQQKLEELVRSSQAIQDVLANPTGVMPNAGAIATALKYEKKETAWVAGPTDTAWVNTWMNTIDRITVGDDPYSQGVGRNFNEMMVGLTRGLGRIPAFEAGVLRFVSDMGERWFPESMTAALRQQAETKLRLANAMQTSQSSVTWENTKSRDAYTAAGGKIPLIDRAFNNEMIFSKPDVAAMTVLSSLPKTPVTAALQVGIAAGQTFETFFATYGRTGSIQSSLAEAGWTTFQNVVGIVFSKLGIGAELAGNVAIVYGVGKARGLSDEQIEEEMAWMLVSILATKGGEQAGQKPGLRATTREILGNLEGRPIEVDATTRAADAKVDSVGTQLETALVNERAIVDKIRVAQAENRDVTALFRELQTAARETSVQRELLQAAIREQPVRPAKAVKPEVTSASTDTSTVKPAVTTETATLDTRIAERDRRFEALFDASIPAADSIPERTFKGLQRLAAEARSKHPELAALSEAELIALIGYTTSDAARINQGLRGQSSEVVNAAAKDYASVVNDALAKLPEQPGTFTRMVQYDAAILAQFVEGGFVREPGFTSTSVLDKAGLGKQLIGGNTELVINGKRGKRIDFLSVKSAEAEVLFPADSTFRVDRVETTGGGTKITLTEVDGASGPVEVIGQPRAIDPAFEQLYRRDVDRTRDGVSPELTWKAMETLAADLKQKHAQLAALSTQEVMALIGITRADAVDVNAGLAGKGDKLAQEAAMYAGHVDRALAKLPAEAGTFFRAGELDAVMLAQLEPGALIKDPTIPALGQARSGSLEVVIQATSARRLDFLAPSNNRSPFVLPSGTIFEVVSVEGRRITLREVATATGWVETLGAPSKTRMPADAAAAELPWDARELTAGDLDGIKAALGPRLGKFPHQDRMIERLELIRAGKLRGTEYDRRFFHHERIEAELRAQGMEATAAHYKTIRLMGGVGDNPYDLSHPETWPSLNQLNLKSRRFTPGMGKEYETGDGAQTDMMIEKREPLP